MPKEEEREPWTLPMSIFKGRSKEADARAFYDGGAVGPASRRRRLCLHPAVICFSRGLTLDSSDSSQRVHCRAFASWPSTPHPHADARQDV